MPEVRIDPMLDRWSALREPFPTEQVSKLPATPKRPSLDYVGHAAVTNRLQAVCPSEWTYEVEPVTVQGQDGMPHVLAVFGTMRIGTVARQEVGAVDAPSTYGQEMKEAISDFIRRAAMRFGVGLDLWSKEDLKDIDRDHRPEPAGNQAPPSLQPGSVEGVTAVEDPSRPVAPIPSAEDRRAVTSVEGEEQESGHPLPPSSPERSEVPASDGSEPGSSSAMGTETPAPDSTRDSLWKQLVEFSGSEAKARAEINKRLKTGWTKGNTAYIPVDDIEHTLTAVLREAG